MEMKCTCDLYCSIEDYEPCRKCAKYFDDEENLTDTLFTVFHKERVSEDELNSR